MKTRMKLEQGEAFSPDLGMHIHRFRMVATYMGLRADRDEIKQLFIDSVQGCPMEGTKDANRKYKSLIEIMQIALDNKRRFKPVIKDQPKN